MLKIDLSKTVVIHVISFIPTERDKVLFGAFDSNDFVTYMQECDVESAHQDKSRSQWRK